MALRVCFLLALWAGGAAAKQQESLTVAANPIRKVVNMLQSMQAKVMAEGDKAKELHEKFLCYCKSAGGDLGASIQAAETKIPAVGSDIETAEAQLAQSKDDLAQAQTDRAAANAAVREATAIRAKEAATFAAFKDESETNIAAITKAVAALEKGAAGSFLQSAAASSLKRLAQTQLTGDDQEELLSFLSGSQNSEYAPSSGQITGILKTMNDEMTAALNDATATENTAIANFGELMAAKKKEILALQASIEAKMTKIGELGVSIAEMKNDLTDTQEGLVADKKFLANLDASCKTATADYEADAKVRGEELLALADTVKILNDDDALEMFKKTLPGASASFAQMQVSSASMRARALDLIAHGPHCDFIALALKGKKIGFEKVIGMIDEMVSTLKAEQVDDASKKEYCDAQFDLSDDKKKAAERSLSDAKAAIAQTEEGIATTNDEIAALLAAIKALDKAVAEATEQRKEENVEYKDLMASNSVAKEILAFAKNRLNKFYNPKLYKPPAKVELSKDDRIVANMGGASFVQISEHRGVAAPPPPPATAAAYTKKSGESGGVIAMIDLLVKDLEKEMTVAKTEEQDNQADYETTMKDSAEKRAQDSKSLTDKEGAKADLEADLEAHKAAKVSATKDLGATLQYIASLHAECDWLLQYFDVRQEARTGEIDSLVKAKAVLSGADFSLVQIKSLRGSA